MKRIHQPKWYMTLPIILFIHNIVKKYIYKINEKSFLIPLIVFRKSIKFCQFLWTECFAASKLKVQEKVNASWLYLFLIAIYWKFTRNLSIIISSCKVIESVIVNVVSVDNTDYHTCLWKFFLPNPFQTKCIQIFSLPDKKLDSSNYSSQNQ